MLSQLRVEIQSITDTLLEHAHFKMVNMCTISFNVKEFCILPTERIYVFHMVLTINSDYFPKQR
jgi:hypothetical protein